MWPAHLMFEPLLLPPRQAARNAVPGTPQSAPAIISHIYHHIFGHMNLIGKSHLGADFY
jgi:hypothetical protein